MLLLFLLCAPILVTPTAERVDPKFGMSRPIFGVRADGQKVVLKTSSHLPYLKPEEQKAADRAQVLASHLLVEEFGQEALTSEEARWQVDGQWESGTSTEFRPNLRTLVEFPIARISNPDSAVGQVIYRELLGDWDMNVTNFVVDQASGRLLSLDFDKALHGGLWPIKSSAEVDICRYYATPGNVEPVLAHIRALTDDGLRQAVDRVGRRWIEGWNEAWRDEYAAALCVNRDLLKGNPYKVYYASAPGWFHRPFEPVREAKGDPRVR